MGPTENQSPPALYGAWDQKLIEMLTGVELHCGLRPGGTSPAHRWSLFTVKANGIGGGGVCRCGQTSDEKNHQNRCQNVIFNVMSEVQKDLEDVSSTGIGK
jgi:hypothetical protein